MKFAIYKNSIGGLSAYRYVDKLEDAPPYISEKSLPVIINDMGGYTTFSTTGFDNTTFVEFREGNENILSFEEKYPLQTPFCYGWVDPFGNAYSCLRTNHYELADALCLSKYNKDIHNPDYFLEERGWMRIGASNNDYVPMVYTNNHHFFLTQKQCNFLIENNLDKHFLTREQIKVSLERLG